MNPQFFRDRHDLFKYDLIFTIMDRMKNDLSSFMFIPMLTKNCPPKNKDIAGTGNLQLWEVFNTLFGDGAAQGYFEGIRQYFTSNGIRTIVSSNPIFSHLRRKEYFNFVCSQLPTNSLIFLDPDTGLKENGATEKHLRFSELRDFFSDLDDNSILMIYQHHYRYKKPNQNFPESISDKVQKEIGARPVYIDNNTIMFLFLTKNTHLKEKIEGVLEDYRKKYPGSFNK